MKKTIVTMLVAAMSCAAFSQSISLPKPETKQQTKSLVETLATRHSVRSFSDKQLTNQQISNLCWAACGVVRDGKHLTSPTAKNKQEIRLFVFTAKGAYEYKRQSNQLALVKSGDHRALIAGGKQTFVLSAPLSLLMVVDLDIFGSADERARMLGCVDAGIVSQNINLYCHSAGLATVPRATHDVAGLRGLLGLSDRQIPVMNNPVGYEKK